MADIKHGKLTSYTRGCRCDECRRAMARYQRDRNAARPKRSGSWGRGARLNDHEEALRALLMELCPSGLTDECPARRGRIAA